MAKLEDIEKLYQTTLDRIVASPTEWKSFLQASAKVYRYDFASQVLIYAQKPAAEACASIDIWNSKMHCWVNRGAKGIALIDKDLKGKKKLRYVFDISDVTKVKNIGRYPYLWVFRQMHQTEILKYFEDIYPVHLAEGNFASAISQLADHLAAIEVESNIELISENSKGSALERLPKEELKSRYQTVLSSSIAYSILSRCDMESDILASLDFSGIENFNTMRSVQSIGTSIQQINDSMLLSIGWIIRNYNMKYGIVESRIDKSEHTFYNNNRKNEERNKEIEYLKGGNENGTGIHSMRRLSDTEPDIERAAGRTADEVGIDGNGLSERTERGEVSRMAVARRGADSSVGDTGSGGEDVYQPRQSDDEYRGRDRETQSREPVGMGAQGKQYPPESGRSSEGRSDLSDLEQTSDFVQMTFLPDFKEQSGNIAVAVEREENTLDAATFSIPEQVIEDGIKLGGKREKSNYFVYQRYIHDQSVVNFKEFLRKEYESTGSGLIIDGNKYSVWFNASGMNVAKGTTALGENTKLIDWDSVTQKTQELITTGRFISKEEAFLSDEYVKKEIALLLQFHLNDNLEENPFRGKEINYLSEPEKIREISNVLWKLDENNLAMGVRTRKQNRMLIDDLYNLSMPYKTYPLSDDVPLPEVNFITKEEIDSVLLHGSNVSGSKKRIYEFFRDNFSESKREDFLKKEYGSGGRSLALGIGGKSYENHDAKGIVISKESIQNPLATIRLSWNNAVRRIAALIRHGQYLSEEEIQTIENQKTESPDKTVSENISKHRLYRQFDEMFPNMLSGNCTYKHFSSDSVTYEPLSVEFIGNDCFSIMHTYVQNGDLMRDPEIVVWIDKDKQELSAISYENSGMGIYREAVKDEEILELNQFLSIWFNNIKIQAQPLRNEYYSFNDHEVHIEYSAAGKVTSLSSTSEEILEQFKREYSEILSEENSLEETSEIPEKFADVLEKAFDNDNPEEDSADRESKQIPAENYQITDDLLGNGTPKEKYQKNIDALKMLKTLETEKRNASYEEQVILSGYVGWGGLADVFDENKPAWSKEYSELKGLLTQEEYHSARASVLNAHYTSPVIIRGIYHTIEKMGFIRGNILEPSCGIGNFFGMLPDKFDESRLYGVELDSISGRIAKQLYPSVKIEITGFEKTDYPNDFFDLCIGNVPFGDYRVNDKEYQNEKFLIHDFFFAKAIDKVRAGGIIAFITSKGTMDKKDETVRRYLAERTELLGAVRLPNTAFKLNAGTEVTSDILFLQKRDAISHDVSEWISTKENNDGILMNSYFVDHPEMIVGKMEMVSGPFGMTSTCSLDENQNFEERLSDALGRITGSIALPEMDLDFGSQDEEVIPADPLAMNFAYALQEDKLYYRENSVMFPAMIPKNQEERIKMLVEIRKSTYELIDLQLNDSSDLEIEQSQKHLNELYDNFEKKYGRINSKTNAKYFNADSGYPMVCSLEEFENDQFVRKADIFTKRTIKKIERVTSVDTAAEALTLSITEKGKVDFDYMSELTGKSEETLVQELTGVIFKNPASGSWETADEYLSGNVRSKLAVARNFAQNNSEYLPNVSALENVQPKELDASEIDVRLGATWIEPEIIDEFIKDTLKPAPYLLRYQGIKVKYSEYTHEWRIDGKNSDKFNPLVTTTYGTERINAYKILEDTLNLKDVQVYDTIRNPDGSESRKLNQKETTVALQKQETLKEAYKDWLFSDRQRRVEITQKYNKLFNSIRPREYVGENLTFPGMSVDIALKEHQKNAVARQIYGPNTLLAHCVGAGKTFEMAAAAMESKRLGLCKKSLFVVPNHLINDWTKDFLRLYPGAKILAAGKKDFAPQNRKKFCSRIATGDYDAVIIGHSMFEKIPLSIERQIASIKSQIDEIETALRTVKYSTGDKFSIKQMEKTRKQLNIKMEKLNDRTKKDNVVTFEQLGIDRLFVDESHYYKNLYHYTKMRNVSGLSSSEAAKSSDLYAKCRYMDEITGGKGITFATGTPISNSMTEMYTNMRYLQFNKLEELGLNFFDAWASTFGESTTEMELAPEGTGFRMKTRFSKFHNIPELINIFKESADIQTSDMLRLPVPEAEYVDIVLEPTEFQKEYIKSLGERAEKIRQGTVDPKVDNMLKITNDGRFLALDQRMIDQTLPDDENSKSERCAQEAYRIWEETKDNLSTQLIFSDISTPNKDGRFSIYDDIKQKLISRGVPESEIAFIHDYDTEKKKEDLFSQVRKGRIRFLFGSTQKMGAGTNVQDKLIALHHLDVPWRPSDIEQQEGRILRQGNENPKVQIYRYIKKGTFDSYSWQLIEKKQRFVSQIMTSKAPVRSADDIDEATLNYAEVKALATGNPKIKEKMELDVEVQKLKLLRADFLNQKYRLEDQIALYYPKKIEEIKEKVDACGKDVRIVEEHAQTDSFKMKLGDSVFNDKKEAGETLLSMLPLIGSQKAFETVGEYRGFAMSVSYDFVNKKYLMKLKGEMSHVFHLSQDVFGNITRINNALAQLPDDLEHLNDSLSRIEKEFDDAKAEVRKTFPQEQEYIDKTERLRILEKEFDQSSEEISADVADISKSDNDSLSTQDKLEKISENASECTVISKSFPLLQADKEKQQLQPVINDVSGTLLDKKVSEGSETHEEQTADKTTTKEKIQDYQTERQTQEKKTLPELKR